MLREPAAKLQFRVLFRQFLFRMVDLELLAPEGDMSKLLGQFAALLIFVSLGLTLGGLTFADAQMPPEALRMMAWSAEHFLISTTMLVVGLFAVLSWDSTFPNRRDVLVLAPLPLRARTLFLAKVAAVATALSVTVVTLHTLPGFAWAYGLARRADVLTVPAPTYNRALPPVDAATLQTVLNRDLMRGQPPGSQVFAPEGHGGAVIGVVQRGVRRTLTYGTAKPDSIFEIGSLTATFTGLALAQLTAQGKVGLEEPVRILLPEGTARKPLGYEITLLDLATHRSGLPPMPDNLDSSEGANPGAEYHRTDLYAFLSRRGVARAADASFQYSNYGIALLAQALADRARMTYGDLLREKVTEPLGLRDTTVSLSPEQQGRLIQGYDGARPVRAWSYDALAGAGGIRSTASDLLIFLEAHLHPERFAAGNANAQTLAAALAQTRELQADAAPGQRMALTWFYDQAAGAYWLEGAIAGYSSYAYFDPKHDSAAVVLLNRTPAGVNFAARLGQHIQQRLSGEPAISLGSTVIPASGGVSGSLRTLAAYWIAMFAAGAFVFCCVLGLQGLAAQALPRRQFLRLSSSLQMAAFCLFVCVYFLEPSVASALGLEPNPRLLAWLPSYWFLGLFQELSGSLHPTLAPLVRRAWVGLALAACGTALAYVLSYVRTLRKIVEEPDIVPTVHGALWLPRFGNPLETAVTRFSIRSVLRSRQHRVILAFYTGLGFALSILMLRTPVAQRQLFAASAAGRWQQASFPLLMASIMMASLWGMGMRMVFAMPLELRANWIFRIMPLDDAPECLAASRRALYVLAMAPVVVFSAAIFLWAWPWRPAVVHVAVLGLLSATLADLGLHGFQKLPFTCSYRPGKTNFHVMILLCGLLVLPLIVSAAEIERRALEDPARSIVMLIILTVAAGLARWRASSEAHSELAKIQFDDVAPPAVFALDLHKDGVTPIAPAE